LLRLISNSASSSFIDYSSFLPIKAALDAANPNVDLALINALPNSILKLGADVGYQNILPVSARIPFASVELSIDEVASFVAYVTALQIDRTSGYLNYSYF